MVNEFRVSQLKPSFVALPNVVILDRGISSQFPTSTLEKRKMLQDLLKMHKILYFSCPNCHKA